MSNLTTEAIYKGLIKAFKLEPTADQTRALKALSEFLVLDDPKLIFLLKGYAGTGKTSLIRSLVYGISQFKLKSALLAPTGRAAKVISQYTGRNASTIHRYIYRVKSGKGNTPGFVLKENKSHNTIFIVDEASMIGSESSNKDGSSLLFDLIRFVSEGVNCRLILVGDIGQLPPVGADFSPALDKLFLRDHYGLDAIEVTMTTVMRQDHDSEILVNATKLRDNQRESDFSKPQFSTGLEVQRLVEGYSIEDALNDSYRDVGREGTIIIVRSNKRANLYNKQIRMRILWQEDRISTGDFLMVVKNSYFWLPDGSSAGFIANGDILEILEIYEFLELYGFDFARVMVRMIDYPAQQAFEVLLNLNVLDLEAASLTWEDSSKLYRKVEEDYANITARYKRTKLIKENPYYNALQVKFAYAITCHKSQGGQWKNVFVEKPWFPNDQLKMDDLRWLYTAFTRAQDKLFLLGFDDSYERSL